MTSFDGKKCIVVATPYRRYAGSDTLFIICNYFRTLVMKELHCMMSVVLKTLTHRMLLISDNGFEPTV